MEAANVLGPEVFDNAAWTPTLLMLDQPRVIAIRDGMHGYTFHFRRITQSDWERYFNGLYVSSRNEGSAQLNTTDVQTAGIELVENTLVKVEGYTRELTKKDDFTKIKPAHAMFVASQLRSVGNSSVQDESPLDPDCVEVFVDAVWSQLKPGDDTSMFKGLSHRFTPPTIEQKRKFLRHGAISRVVGGSRKGTTIYSQRNTVLIDLYDQLIQSVDGYGVNGASLQGVDSIRREMDAYHKCEALAQLFNSFDSAASSAEEAA